MSKSNAVATTTPAGLPALPPTQALDIDAGDVALPRVKVGQPQSPHVIDDNVAKGCLFSTTGSDDEYPVQLYTHGDPAGLLIHVIGMHKGKSLTDANDELQTWAFNDPDAPAEARTTYNYVLYLPEHDTEVPYKFLMTSTATSTARQINTVLKRNEARGPAYITAFRITTKKREAEKDGRKFSWFVPVVTVVDHNDSNVVAAGKLASLIGGAGIEQSAGPAASEPAI